MPNLSYHREDLFWYNASSRETAVMWKFNYITLFVCHYIYLCNLNSLAISILDIITKLHLNTTLKMFY